MGSSAREYHQSTISGGGEGKSYPSSEKHGRSSLSELTREIRRKASGGKLVGVVKNAGEIVRTRGSMMRRRSLGGGGGGGNLVGLNIPKAPSHNPHKNHVKRKHRRRQKRFAEFDDDQEEDTDDDDQGLGDTAHTVSSSSGHVKTTLDEDRGLSLDEEDASEASLDCRRDLPDMLSGRSLLGSSTGDEMSISDMLILSSSDAELDVVQLDFTSLQPQRKSLMAQVDSLLKEGSSDAEGDDFRQVRAPSRGRLQRHGGSRTLSSSELDGDPSMTDVEKPLRESSFRAPSLSDVSIPEEAVPDLSKPLREPSFRADTIPEDTAPHRPTVDVSSPDCAFNQLGASGGKDVKEVDYGSVRLVSCFSEQPSHNSGSLPQARRHSAHGAASDRRPLRVLSASEVAQEEVAKPLALKEAGRRGTGGIASAVQPSLNEEELDRSSGNTESPKLGSRTDVNEPADGDNRFGRIPAALQEIFVAAARGAEIHAPPPCGLAFKVLVQDSSEAGRRAPIRRHSFSGRGNSSSGSSPRDELLALTDELLRKEARRAAKAEKSAKARNRDRPDSTDRPGPRSSLSSSGRDKRGGAMSEDERPNRRRPNGASAIKSKPRRAGSLRTDKDDSSCDEKSSTRAARNRSGGTRRDVKDASGGESDAERKRRDASDRSTRKGARVSESERRRSGARRSSINSHGSSSGRTSGSGTSSRQESERNRAEKPKREKQHRRGNSLEDAEFSMDDDAIKPKRSTRGGGLRRTNSTRLVREDYSERQQAWTHRELRRSNSTRSMKPPHHQNEAPRFADAEISMNRKVVARSNSTRGIGSTSVSSEKKFESHCMTKTSGAPPQRSDAKVAK